VVNSRERYGKEIENTNVIYVLLLASIYIKAEKIFFPYSLFLVV
jgi:hypothetical protein